jgi:hypothetical protein
MLTVLIAFAAAADGPRVLPPGRLPADHRLGALKDTFGYFPFRPPSSREEWEKRAERLRRQILVSQGLWPMPERTPLNAVIHGAVDRDGYAVERVYFESHPGLFVTGNLYRPKGRTGKMPGILCPHGHWAWGRFMDSGIEATRIAIAQGAERHEEGGRSLLQSRCVQLARMGCVVFHYDMLSYADSIQFNYNVAHGLGSLRPEMNTVENWGLLTAQAETHLQSPMGLQTWNSIRALDFLESLPGVDPARLAVIGESGGGVQTFILGAVDSRVALEFPVGMVSTTTEGGCPCDNACLLRVGAGNLDFAALFAPKPLGMTAADDSTRDMAFDGFPELQQLYRLYGARENVMLETFLQFRHNFNYPSRAVMYNWVNRHFKLGIAEPIIEPDYRRLSTGEMTVWDDRHPKPPSGPDFERKLVRHLTDQSDRQMQRARHNLPEYQRLVLGALEVMIGRNLEEAGQVEFQPSAKLDRGSFFEVPGLLRNTTWREELPVVRLTPKQSKGWSVIWLDREGKAGLYLGGRGAAGLRPEVRRLIESGATVIGADLIYQGEFLADGQPVRRTPVLKNEREFASYTFGYNSTVFSQRVQDILSLIQHARGDKPKLRRIALVGVHGAGPLASAAQGLARDAIDDVAVDNGDFRLTRREVVDHTQTEACAFRFSRLTDHRDPDFLPGGAKYDDLPGMLAAGLPKRLFLAGEGIELPEAIQAAFKAAGGIRKVRQYEGPTRETPAAVVEWLLER